MANFKMILPEVEVKETLKNEIDDTVTILIEFTESDYLKDFLRKYKENKYVDLYITEKQFKEQYNNKNLIELRDIEILAFQLEESSVVIKLHHYEYIPITELRKSKIKNILNN